MMQAAERKRYVLLLLLVVTTMTGTAQKGDELARRTSMVNDSVRLEESYLSKSGQVLSRRYYVDTRPVGVWQQYDRKGRLTAERDFSKLHYGEPHLVAIDTVRKDTTTTPWEEKLPEFPGGEQELFRFLTSNTIFPTEAVEEGLSGTVIITGRVDETGAWTTEAIQKSAHPILDYEAWRVAELIPDWKPGEQKGRPVKVRYNLPVRFYLR